MSIAISDIIWSLSVCIVSSVLVYVLGSTIFTCKVSDVTNTLVNINNLIVHRDVYCEVLDLKIDNEIGFTFCIVLVVLSALLMLISVTVSLVLLIFAAADRYFALAFPLKYKSTNTIKRAKIS